MAYNSLYWDPDYDDDYYDDSDTIERWEFEESEVKDCCAATLLHDFPDAWDEDDLTKEGLDYIERKLKEKIKSYKGNQCIIVFTTDKQKSTNKILKKLGFESTTWMKKPKHSSPENKLRLWWKRP